MMRNVVDVAQAFREQQRVVRPGARVVCLEATQPATPLFRELFAIYFGQLVPAIGGLISEGDAYTYLPASVRAFLTPPELAEVMREAGLRDVVYYRLALGHGHSARRNETNWREPDGLTCRKRSARCIHVRTK